MHRRRIAVSALVVTAALGLAGSAAAAQPGAIPEPVDFDVTVDGICDFPIQLQGGGKAGVVELPGGRALLTAPGQTITVTNADAPEHSVTLRVTGTFTETPLAGGATLVTAHGPSGLFDPVLGFVYLRGQLQLRGRRGRERGTGERGRRQGRRLRTDRLSSRQPRSTRARTVIAPSAHSRASWAAIRERPGAAKNAARSRSNVRWSASARSMLACSGGVASPVAATMSRTVLTQCSSSEASSSAPVAIR